MKILIESQNLYNDVSVIEINIQEENTEDILKKVKKEIEYYKNLQSILDSQKETI